MGITIDAMRGVDFARSYGWGVQFSSYSGEFFPATTMTDVFADFANGTVEYGPYTFSFPERVQRGKTLTFEIYEISTHDVYLWLVDWKKAVQGPEFTTALIGDVDVARPCIIQRLNLQRGTVDTAQVFVIPEGEITANFGSEKGGAPLSIQLTLAVVGFTG